jgi:hypothetical protein
MVLLKVVYKNGYILLLRPNKLHRVQMEAVYI